VSRYLIATLPYPDRRAVLDAVGDAVTALQMPSVNVSLDGGVAVYVEVTAPPERIGSHTPEET
jgi:hypothetical protein